MIAFFTITIDSTDTRNDVIRTIRGAGSILDLVEGRDLDANGVPGRYVLKPSLLPLGTAEIPCKAVVAINQNVPAVVRNEYSNNAALWMTLEFWNTVPTPTRTYMQQRLVQLAGEQGASHYWPIIPGDALTGDLLSHFVPIQ